MHTAGTPLASTSCFTSAETGACDIAGPSRISGRAAEASKAASVATVPLSSAFSIGMNCAAVAKARSPSATLVSSTSKGKLRCTGPGLPDRAMRQALAMSAPSDSALAAIHDALTSGAAMSA